MLEHPVPPEHLQEIGDMTVSFALLESTLQSLSGFLLTWNAPLDRAQNNVEHMVMASLSFKGLRALISGLAKERYGDGKPEDVEISALLKRAQAIEERRNTLTHSLWAAGKTAHSITRIKATIREKSGHNFVFEHLELDQLRPFPIAIRQLAGDVQELNFKLAQAADKVVVISVDQKA